MPGGSRRRLPNVPETHRCHRMHGHSYRVELTVAGPVDPRTGWVIDFYDIESIFGPLLARLDQGRPRLAAMAGMTAASRARVFLSRTGGPLDGATVYRIVSREMQALGRSGGPHLLRHQVGRAGTGVAHHDAVGRHCVDGLDGVHQAFALGGAATAGGQVDDVGAQGGSTREADVWPNWQSSKAAINRW